MTLMRGSSALSSSSLRSPHFSYRHRLPQKRRTRKEATFIFIAFDAMHHPKPKSLLSPQQQWVQRLKFANLLV